jgi:hypothetical protein
MWRFSQRVTRQDLDFKLGKEFAPIKTDLAVLKWMMAALIIGVLSLVVKAFG